MAVTPAVNVPVARPTVNLPVVDWDKEWRYDELMKVPEVRQIIERHT